MLEGEVYTKKDLAEVKKKFRPTQNIAIKITAEAKAVLEAEKSQRSGYTECLLASEAIIAMYKHGGAAVAQLPPQANGEGDPVEFAARLVSTLGTPGAALRHLDSYVRDGSFRIKVQNELVDMLEKATAKGGK